MYMKLLKTYTKRMQTRKKEKKKCAIVPRRSLSG